MSPPGLTATPNKRRNMCAVTRQSVSRDLHNLLSSHKLTTSPSAAEEILRDYSRQSGRGRFARHAIELVDRSAMSLDTYGFVYGELLTLGHLVDHVLIGAPCCGPRPAEGLSW